MSFESSDERSLEPLKALLADGVKLRQFKPNPVIALNNSCGLLGERNDYFRAVQNLQLSATKATEMMKIREA